MPHCQQAVVSIEMPEVLVRAHCMAGSCCCNSPGTIFTARVADTAAFLREEGGHCCQAAVLPHRQ